MIGDVTLFKVTPSAQTVVKPGRLHTVAYFRHRVNREVLLRVLHNPWHIVVDNVFVVHVILMLSS